MKFVFFIIFLFLIPLIQAETTFFDQDDAFIMGNSQATPTTGQVTDGGGCRYEWNCTNWGECLSSGKQTRNCTNIGTCSDTYKTPEIEQNCTYISPEIKKENGIEKVGKEGENDEIADKNKILIYSVIILIILFIVLYLKKDYFKKLIKK